MTHDFLNLIGSLRVCMPTRLIILLVAGLTIATPLKADSYGPFLNSRIVEPTGRYYLVIRKAKDAEDKFGFALPVTFTLAERRPGSRPVTSERDGADFREVKPNPRVQVRDGDLVHGRGSFERCPGEFLISSTGLGFVGVDTYGHNYPVVEDSVSAIVIVSRDGTVRHQKKLSELLPQGVGRFLQTAEVRTGLAVRGSMKSGRRSLSSPLGMEDFVVISP